MLVLIAGRGALPSEVANELDARPLVAALEGERPDDLTPEITFRVEALGSFLETLRARGISEVCFAGGIRRPALDPEKVDAATMPLVPRMLQALNSGDDAALRIVLDFFEEAGFGIRAAQDIAPGLLPEPGHLALRKANPDDDEDTVAAQHVLAAMGGADIGQACVVRRRRLLAVEAAFGTDWMLESLEKRPDGRGGILYKAPKPDQDRRVDLPAIGPATIAGAAAAGLDGIVLEAGGVMVLDRAATVAAADAAGLFLWIRAS